MPRRLYTIASVLTALIMMAVNGYAQTPGVAVSCDDDMPVFDRQTANVYASAQRASVLGGAKVAYNDLTIAKHYNATVARERSMAGEVTDAYLDFYPQPDYLRILNTPGRPSVIAAPYHAKSRSGSAGSLIKGLPAATLGRVYRSDSSVEALASWYSAEYGFEFKLQRTPLGSAGTDTLIVARAVRQFDNTVATVLIWSPSTVSQGRSGGRKSVTINHRTSVEVQERVFRPREDLIVEGPDAAVDLTWKVPYRDLIQRVSLKYQVDPHLVAALVQQESNFNPNAVSVDSAMGLTQMIPGTAQMLGVTDPTNPRQALEGGVRYLKMLLRRFKGNVEYALAGYNAGPGNVDKYRGVPPFSETRDYVRRIIARYREKAGGARASTARIVRSKL